MNIQFAQNILQQLASHGIRTLCVCPGARNAPFIEILSRQNYFEIISFYDERSAGFFALGRARRDGLPVAVLTTSGTAVSELLSPVIEAFYSNVPLVVVSADRPKRLRGTGAPQTIDQTKIFTGHVEKILDFEIKDFFEFEFSKKKPIHVNVCFDEPLVEGDLLNYSFYSPVDSSVVQIEPIVSYFPILLKKPLIVVGALSEGSHQAVIEFLNRQDCPVYTECLSGLRGSELLLNKGFQTGEKFISKLLKIGNIQSVLRIGDVPVGRFWRDLDKYSIKILSINNKEFCGAWNSDIIQISLDQINDLPLELEPWDWSCWKKLDGELKIVLEKLFLTEPMSEVGIINSILALMTPKDTVFVGNSMPIRHWDLVSNVPIKTFANRGVNGIDGQLSTALGLAKSNSTMWVILGDLTTLYDFSGFWTSEYLKTNNIKVNLIVLNNYGGQIFDRIFKNPLFKNEHKLDFESLAKMWGWNYFDQISNEVPLGLNLIEIKIEQGQSTRFWEAYDKLW